LPRLADQLANRRHVGPELLSFPASGGSRRTRKPNSISLEARCLRLARETDSARKTRNRAFVRRQKQRITRRKARDRAKQNRPNQGPAWLVFDRIVSV
jgi:hypothetical protein